MLFVRMNKLRGANGISQMNRLLVLAFFILSAWTLPQSSSAVLVGHWSGDGNANDVTGNGHDGTVFGDTTYAPGVIGNGFLLDGDDDYVAIANSPSLESTVFTVAAFVKMPDTGNTQRLIFDSSHGFVDFSGWALQTENSGTVSILFGDGNTFKGAASTTQIDDNDFHHIAGVVDGSSMTIYVDGTLENTFIHDGLLSASGREVRIGAAWGGAIGGSIREVAGIIDDVRYYDQALSSAQVQNLASAVPEPSSALALGLPLALTTFIRRRKQRVCSRVTG